MYPPFIARSPFKSFVGCGHSPMQHVGYFICLTIYRLTHFSDVLLEQWNFVPYSKKWHGRDRQDGFQEAEGPFGSYDAQTNKGTFIPRFLPATLDMLSPRYNAQMISGSLHERWLSEGITLVRKKKSCIFRCFLMRSVSSVPMLIQVLS